MTSAVALVWAGAAAAQGAPAGGVAQIEEVIVTASRHDETVQKTSLALEAFSEDQLRDSGLSQPADLTKLVLGLQVSAVGPGTGVYIRGVGATSGNPLSNPAVIFNVDGVYVGRPESVNSNFYDIARMEVVKGPQGTLYGRNASGGAINLLTNAPVLGQYGGAVNLELGNYNLAHVDGAINLPLGETVALRAAFNRVKRDGYLSDGTNDDDQTAGRVKLLYEPNSAVSLLLSADFASLRGKGGGYVYRRPRTGDAWEGLGTDVSNAYLASFAGSNRVTPQGKDAFLHNDYWNVSAQLDWDLGFATLTVIPAYRHSDIDGQFYAMRRTRNTATADQDTFEARLSHDGPAIKWVAGAYYFHEENPGSVSLLISPAVNKSRFDYDPEATAYALFGEAKVSVSDRFRLIGGLRQTSERRVLSGNFFTYPGGGDIFVNTEAFNGDKTFEALTWKVGAEYDLAAKSMLYLTASKGFKSGGINQTVPPDNIFQPEEVLAYELGARNRFFDSRLQVNLEAFYWTYENQQNTTQAYDSVGVLNFLTRNAGNATVYGLNVDVVARPTAADTLRVAAEYTNSNYSEYFFTVPSFLFNQRATGCRNLGVTPAVPSPVNRLDCSGYELPHVARWSGRVDYSHNFAVGSGATVEFNANARLSSSYGLSVDFTPIERAPAFATVNASLTYLPPVAKWSATAYVRNITNSVEYTNAQQSSQVLDLLSATISPPRTYGVQLRYKW